VIIVSWKIYFTFNVEFDEFNHLFIMCQLPSPHRLIKCKDSILI